MKQELKALTIVRYPAAFGVVIYHFFDRESAPWLLENLASGGFVTLFFMLSGFMLAYVTRGPIDFGQFMLRRLSRLYPMYIVAWLLFAIFTWRAMPTTGDFVRTLSFYGMPALLMVQTWLPKTASLWNWPSWSVSAEVFFCLLFPVLLPWLRRVRRLDLALLALLLANVLIYVIRAELAEQPQPMMLEGTSLATSWNRYINYFPPAFLAQFMMGMVLGRLFVERGPVAAKWSIVAIAACFVVLACPRSIAGLGREAFLCFVYCGLLYTLASLQLADTPVVRQLQKLGRSSYSLFILQSPVWKLYWTVLGYEDRQRSLTEMIPYLILLAVLGLLAHRFIEVPVAQWINQKFERGPRTPRVEAVTP